MYARKIAFEAKLARAHSRLRGRLYLTIICLWISQLQTGTWTWTYEGNSLNINYVEQGSEGEGAAQETLLLLPSLSDVSTTEEWYDVAEELVTNAGSCKRRAVIVDWPGLGLSDRPALEYTVDMYEKFLVDFVTAANGPLAGVQGQFS